VYHTRAECGFVLEIAMLSLYAPATSAFTHATAPRAPCMLARAASPAMETKADLETLASACNPILGFYDPLNLSGADFWGKGSEATIGWLRHSEIKHGRIAMFAFVGYIVQANGIHFPFPLTTSGITYADISAAGFPNQQWDALPTLAKLQIFGAIGLLEWFGESSYALEQSGLKHYTKGGKPGAYPSLKTAGVPHPVPFDLFDPFGLSKSATPEQKAKGLVAEINNGRLAMIGIMGFVAATKGPLVPFLDGKIAPYAGEPMAPFSEVDVSLPMVKEMLTVLGGGGFPGL